MVALVADVVGVSAFPGRRRFVYLPLEIHEIFHAFRFQVEDGSC